MKIKECGECQFYGEFWCVEHSKPTLPSALACSSGVPNEEVID